MILARNRYERQYLIRTGREKDEGTPNGRSDAKNQQNQANRRFGNHTGRDLAGSMANHRSRERCRPWEPTIVATTSAEG